MITKKLFKRLKGNFAIGKEYASFQLTSLSTCYSINVNNEKLSFEKNVFCEMRLDFISILAINRVQQYKLILSINIELHFILSLNIFYHVFKMYNIEYTNLINDDKVALL